MKRGFRWKFVAVAVALGLAVATIAGGYVHYLDVLVATMSRKTWTSEPGGTLIICGGGSVPTEVRECLVACAGGPKARLAIIPAYEASPDDRADLIAAWQAFPVESVDVVDVSNRAESDSAAVVDVLSHATGVWLGGGDQSRLGELYAGTEVERQLHKLLERGGVVGGTSAGAAAMTRVMISGERDRMTEQLGFDLLSGAVIDQHFFHRNRSQRLLEILAKHPELIGLGVDEHSAVVVQRGGTRWSVIGESYAMICLPSGAAFPRLEILKAGDSADITLLKDHPEIAAINSPGEVDEMVRTHFKP